MNDRLRMNDGLDAVVREAVKEMRLDDFERLVRQRGAVDRDLGAHVPRWMSQRIGARDVLQLVQGMTAKGTTRGGQNQPPDLTVLGAAQTLQNRAVLAVDGNQLTTATAQCLQH